MACFLVPAAEAVATAVVKKVAVAPEKEDPQKVTFLNKLPWLTKLLTGGSVLLCFEHVWHGEVVPWFPFLTAAANPEDAAVMLQEMGSVGGSMAVFLTVVWVGMVLAAKRIVAAEPASEPVKA